MPSCELAAEIVREVGCSYCGATKGVRCISRRTVLTPSRSHRRRVEAYWARLRMLRTLALDVDTALIKLLADAAFTIGGTSEQHDALDEAWKAFNDSRAALAAGGSDE